MRTNYGSITWNVFGDNSIRTNVYIVSNRDRTEDNGSSPYTHVIAYTRVSITSISNCNILINP